MMTIRQQLANHLTSQGLWPADAAAVTTIVVDRTALTAIRWDDRVEAYPPTLMPVLYAMASHYAVQWIDANKPQHWARGMFTEDRDHD